MYCTVAEHKALNIEHREKEREEEDGGGGGRSVRNCMNDKEGERRQKGVRIHRKHVSGKRNACGLLVRK
jgi:hypothetical protein